MLTKEKKSTLKFSFKKISFNVKGQSTQVQLGNQAPSYDIFVGKKFLVKKDGAYIAPRIAFVRERERVAQADPSLVPSLSFYGNSHFIASRAHTRRRTWTFCALQ